MPLKSLSTFKNNELSSLSLCLLRFSESMVGVCFQERSLSCVKQMVVGDPSPSIPVYGNICSYILVSESLQLFWAERLFFFLFCFKRRCAAVASLSVCFESMCSVTLHRWCALPRWEASSLRNLWEDVLPVRQQERPHEEEAWRGGAR